MFSLLWGTSEKSPNGKRSGAGTSCCGDREKEDDPKSAKLVPHPEPIQAFSSKSGDADLNKAYPEVLESPPNPADILGDQIGWADQLQKLEEAAEEALEHMVGADGRGSMLAQMSDSDEGDERTKVVLDSYEDREYTAQDDGIQSTDSDDSDEEKLKASAKNLRESMKKVAGLVKGKKDEYDVEGTVFDNIRDAMEAMKVGSGHGDARGRKNSPTRDAPGDGPSGSGPRMGRSNSVISVTSGISREVSLAGDMGEAMEGGDDPQSFGFGHTGSVDSNTTGNRTSIMGAAPDVSTTIPMGPTHTMALFSGGKDKSHGEDDDEEDDPDGMDDEAAINKKYHKRYRDATGVGMENKVEQLRTYMERVGIDEPAIADAQPKVSGKVFVLNMVFMVKNMLEQWEEKTVTFSKKPLGIKWNRRVPITIAEVKIDSYAEHMKVDVGWVVKEINSVDCTSKTYAATHAYLMKCVNWLPEEAPQQSVTSKPKTGESLGIVVNVTIETAWGFHDNDAQHFCVCAIPGKPHSRIETDSQCVNDTPDTDCLEWHQTYELFDFQSDDPIEFAVYARERVVSEHGEDSSLGRVRLGYSEFSQGFQGEVTLRHPHSGLSTKTKMKVKIQVDMVPERQKAIHTYRRIMKDRLVALNVKEKDLKASFAGADNYSSCADALRESLLDYHQQSERMGKYYPFPGGSAVGNGELEQDAAKKLKDYTTRLRNDDPDRLWAPQDALKGDDEYDFSAKSSMMSALDIRSNSPLGRSKSGAEHSPSMLEIVFLDKKKKAHPIIFMQQPLGIEFWQKSPLKVTGFLEGSHALEMGVEQGWKISSIDGVECSKMRYSEASKLLYDNLATLPRVGDESAEDAE